VHASNCALAVWCSWMWPAPGAGSVSSCWYGCAAVVGGLSGQYDGMYTGMPAWHLNGIAVAR
jgi:hypothetical protein